MMLNALFCLFASASATILSVAVEDDQNVTPERVQAYLKPLGAAEPVISIQIPTNADAHEVLPSVITTRADEFRKTASPADSIRALVLNVREPDKRQKYGLGPLGSLTAAGPDDTLRESLAPLAGALPRDARVILLSSRIDLRDIKDAKVRLGGLMSFLGAVDGVLYVHNDIPGRGPARSNADVKCAVGVLIGLCPLALFTPIAPIIALPLYVGGAAAVLGARRIIPPSVAARPFRGFTDRPAVRVSFRAGVAFAAEGVWWDEREPLGYACERELAPASKPAKKIAKKK